jgi:predicted peptidase
MKRFSVLIAFCLGFISLKAQDKSAFVKTIFVSKGDTLPVRILYPENFDPKKKYPLMLFLHGRGESGKDNEKQLIHGSKMFLDPTFRAKYQAVVVFPQCSDDSYWANVKITTGEKGKRNFEFLKRGKPTQAMRLLRSYLDELEDLSYLDQNRFYVGGLSMGGMGTYELLSRESKTFAAAFAICGGSNVSNVKKYANKLPLWLFHGLKDDVVKPEFTINIANELKRLGADYKLNLYPNANHNSWDAAFAEQELLPWLFSYSRK